MKIKPIEGKWLDEGVFTGYAATWDVDRANEQFVKGAFAKSISERCAGIPIVVRHAADGGDVFETVGSIIGAHEDDVGLAVSGKFIDTPRGKEAAHLVRSGAVRGLSVGYDEIRKKSLENGITQITEARWIELTITNFPCNDKAKILDAKSTPGSPSEMDAEPTWIEHEEMALALYELEHSFTGETR